MRQRQHQFGVKTIPQRLSNYQESPALAKLDRGAPSTARHPELAAEQPGAALARQVTFLEGEACTHEEAGKELGAIMQALRWKSPSQPARYAQALAADTNAAAQVVGEF